MHTRRAGHVVTRPLNCGVRRQMMRSALVGYLVLVALVAALGGIASISGIPDAFSRFEGEPEDFHLLLFWLLLCALVFTYCAVGVFKGTRRRAFGLSVAGKVLSAIVFLLGAAIVLVPQAPLLTGLWSSLGC
jgi:hypothetical protein